MLQQVATEGEDPMAKLHCRSSCAAAVAGKETQCLNHKDIQHERQMEWTRWSTYLEVQTFFGLQQQDAGMSFDCCCRSRAGR
jgi:hypothetical protein